jgi:N-acetylglucosamine kinase-like BadF-type ATPase
MTQYFLGIDTGGTKSHALITDDQGQALALYTGGPGNHEGIGFEAFGKLLHTITENALHIAGLRKDQITAAGLGIAGFDWPSDYDPIDTIIRSLELGENGSAPYKFVNDATLGIIAGSSTGWGVCVGAGTGCNCRGRDAHGREGRVTGEGMGMGEAGGAIELVLKGLQAVSMAWSKRGPDTILSQLYVDYYGVKDVDDLLEHIFRKHLRMSPAAAPMIFKAAEQGDRVANDLIEWISRELALMGIGVIRQLGLENQEFEVVLSGSFYKGSPRIQAIMNERIHEVAPGAHLVRLTAPPVVGSNFLAMEQVGFDWLPLREKIIASTDALHHKIAHKN